jgi:hypothetical protein
VYEVASHELIVSLPPLSGTCRAYANGTSRILANVLAINVFPVPVGPLSISSASEGGTYIMSTLLFSNTTSSFAFPLPLTSFDRSPSVELIFFLCRSALLSNGTSPAGFSDEKYPPFRAIISSFQYRVMKLTPLTFP